jgi:hypothetical protein
MKPLKLALIKPENILLLAVVAVCAIYKLFLE